jgi:hypothetical protein
MLWLLILIVAVLGGAWIGYRVNRDRRPALPAPESTALLERTLKDVRPNDIVQHDGKDYLVEGVITYDEDGHTWRCARMVDAGVETWLLVGLERGGPLTTRMLTPSALEVTGYPTEAIDKGGVSYKLDKRGTATATFQGDLPGMPSPGEGGSVRCRWWKYTAVGEKVLIVEQWGEAYRAMAGETVKEGDVELLAAS